MVVLSFAATSNAYSFLSCVDYDSTQDICYGTSPAALCAYVGSQVLLLADTLNSRRSVRVDIAVCTLTACQGAPGFRKILRMQVS